MRDCNNIDWRDPAHQGELVKLLETNESKPSRERLTLMRIFEELRQRGFEGGYDSVRRYARSWQRDRASTAVDAFVPLSFAPGEAYQFDWSHEVVVMNGTTVTIKAAHMRLCHSRMLFVRAYLSRIAPIDVVAVTHFDGLPASASRLL
jgi:transposase